MFDKIIWLILLTFIPSMELRLSIPVGLSTAVFDVPFFGQLQGFGMDPLTVILICIGANIVLGPIAYFCWKYAIKLFLFIPIIKKLYDWFAGKLEPKRPIIEKYGIWGVAFLVGVPLPGSGTWSGAMISSIVDIDFKKFLIGNTIGVIIAGILVTLIYYFAEGIFLMLGF